MLKICVSFIFCLFFMVASARAATSPWVNGDHVAVQLLAAGNQAALDVRPEAGWHFYWRTPGDAGQAPHIDWQGATNLDHAIIAWPAPKRFAAAGLASFGYDTEEILPLTLQAKTPGQAIKLQGSLSLLICRDVCIPETLPLNLTVPTAMDVDAAAMAKALAALPVKGEKPALKIDSVIVGPDALVVRAYAAHGFAKADLFAEPPVLHLFNPPEITPDKDDLRHATLRIGKSNASQNVARDVMGKVLVLTLTTQDGAVEKTIPF